PSSTLHTYTNITGNTHCLCSLNKLLFIGTKKARFMVINIFICQYRLMKSENKTTVHVVNMKSFENQTYTIRIKKEDNEIRFYEMSNQTAFEIPLDGLKPCTEYNISVDGCKPNGKETFSNTVVTKVTENKVCLKGDVTGIKWNLTECVEITMNNSCTSTHTVKLDKCNYTMNVELPPVKPVIRFNATIPSKFEWTNKPEKCQALLKVSCTQDKNKTYDLNDTVSLLPQKEYSCTGEYPYEKQPIKSNSLFINIACENRSPISKSGISCSHFHILFINAKDSIDFYDVLQKPSHNSVQIQCSDIIINWNGDPGTFEAVIKYNGDPVMPAKEDTSCWFSFSDLHYLTTYDIEVFISHLISYNDKAVIGFLTFLIVVTTIALLFVLFKIYLLKRKRTAEDEEILLTQPLRRVEPIYAGGLVEAYKNKIADEGRLFMDEFQILLLLRAFPEFSLITPSKKRRNQKTSTRTATLTFYDYNRVTLSTGGEDNYINASFIEGYREPKKYIAAQGPKDETVVDFWRMVWEQKSSIIVMVTRCEEGNKTKCAQYWPSLDRETEIFEDFVVKIRSEEHCPDYVIRHLILNNKREKASEREVTHIQFISWPDHGVPGDPSLLLKLRRRVNSFKNFFSGPVVVHCSAGVGRTGTYMSIDAMIESLEAEGRVDIYGFVAKLRRQRCLMVQVEAQYILIHTALIEYNQFGETEVSLSEFHSVLNTLRQKNGSDPSLLEKEFQKLPKFKKWRTMNTGSSEDNKKKNRDSAVIPYDFNRVIFRLDIEGNQTSDPEDEEEYSSDEEEESNQYINASFIDGYWCNKSLIAAQGPLPSTAEEFLLMLYQQQTKTLVMLTDCQEDGKVRPSTITQRQTQRQRDRDRDTETQRQRDRYTETQRQRHRERDRETERQRDRDTERQRQRDRDTETETETQRQRDRDTDTDRETERQRDRETERQRQRHRHRDRETET
uniref:protein-tyrosine-phosphatase n=1 Tax=Cyprinus carpio TaxID=7962 RepID=A0A8C2A7U9_CYPCA